MAGMISFRRGNSLMNTGFADLSSMFDDFFTDGFTMRKSLVVNTFKIDIQDKEKEYIVEAELPGIDKSNIQLSLNEETLNISVYNENEKNEDNKNYVHRERVTSSMTRKVYLPNSESEGIKAKMDNGVLEIVIPKKVKVDTSTKIDIE